MDGQLGRGALARMPRQLDRQFRATFRQIPGMNLATEVLNDAVRDRQTEAQPLAQRLGREEWIEDLVDLASGNARSVVGDAYEHSTLRGMTTDADPRGGVIGESIKRIAHEIENDLFQLHRVTKYPKIRRDVLLDAHARGPDLAVEKKQRAVDGSVDPDWFRMA